MPKERSRGFGSERTTDPNHLCAGRQYRVPFHCSSQGPGLVGAARARSRCSHPRAPRRRAAPTSTSSRRSANLESRPRRRPLPAQRRARPPRPAEAEREPAAAPRRRAPLLAHGRARTSSTTPSPGGATMVDRIRRTGYTSGARGWSLGENIAWGSGRLATAAQIQRSLDEVARATARTSSSARSARSGSASRPACPCGSPRRSRAPRTPQTSATADRAGPAQVTGRRRALLASAAPWPTSSPSTPSTTRSTASAACRPSWRRPTT